jgi:hypothetical protein
MDKCFEDMNILELEDYRLKLIEMSKSGKYNELDVLIELSLVEERLSCLYDDIIEQEVSYYDVMREEDGRHYGLGM